MRLHTLLVRCIYSLIFTIFLAPVISYASETVTVNGSGSALDMMKPMIAAFQKNNRDIKVVMEKPLGSSGAVKALLSGALDIVMSSKQLKPEETAKGAQLQVYGKMPLVIIADKKVNKTDITTKELEEIYSGKNNSWPNGTAIRLILRPTEDIDTKILSALSPGMAQAVKAAHARTGMTIAVTDPEAYSIISKSTGGMGLTGMSSIITEKLPVTSLTLNGVAPSPATLANGTYPLAKEINIVTTAKTSAAANKLISFITSQQGRTIANKTGVVVSAGAVTNK